MSIEERLASGEYSQVECYKIGYKEAIDKACEWMKIHLPMVLDRYYPEGNNDIPDADVLNEDIRVYFRKAMEG